MMDGSHVIYFPSPCVIQESNDIHNHETEEFIAIIIIIVVVVVDLS